MRTVNAECPATLLSKVLGAITTPPIKSSWASFFKVSPDRWSVIWGRLATKHHISFRSASLKGARNCDHLQGKVWRSSQPLWLTAHQQQLANAGFFCCSQRHGPTAADVTVSANHGNFGPDSDQFQAKGR